MTRERALTYKVWHAMRKRCSDPSYDNYRRYGARGIKVCERWESFDAFIEDMGMQPPGMILDRRDNDGDYEPKNCRWVTPSESCRNTSRNRFYTAHGKTQCLVDWAKECGLSQQALWARLNKGWSFEEAISLPVMRRHQIRAFIDTAKEAA